MIEASEASGTGELAPGEHSVMIDGLPLHYHVAGQGPVCLVHPGGPGVGWEYLRMPEVERYLTLVYIEPIGTGRSGRLADPRGYILDMYVRFVRGLIEHLGLEKAYLLGHSHGGFVAQRYALENPERLAGLILYDTVPTLSSEWHEDVAQNLERYADYPWFSDAVTALEQEGSAQSDEEFTELLRRMLPLYFADYDGREREFAPMRESLAAFGGPNKGEDPKPFDVRDNLTTIRVPTLVIVGRYDFICSEKFAHILHEGIPNSWLVVLKNSGHFGHIEEPETFAGAIEDFINLGSTNR